MDQEATKHCSVWARSSLKDGNGVRPGAQADKTHLPESPALPELSPAAAPPERFRGFFALAAAPLPPAAAGATAAPLPALLLRAGCFCLFRGASSAYMAGAAWLVPSLLLQDPSY